MTEQREVLEVEKLGMRYGAVTALADVSFRIRGPQVVGILGPNGAGKSTLLEILEGLRPATSGVVRLFGARLEPGRYPRQRVGVVLQREPLFEGVTVGEYAQLFAALYRVAGGGAQILAQAGLESRVAVAVERLSGGEAQRLFLAAAVVHQPELVFLDEPSAHLDPVHRAQMGEQIRLLGRRCTVLLSTHDLDEADRICDSALFLLGGRVKAFGTLEQLVSGLPTVADAPPIEPPLVASRRLERAFFFHCSASISASGELK